MREVFGDAAPLISSTKSLTGHSLGAAGAQEAIYCLLMMQRRLRRRERQHRRRSIPPSPTCRSCASASTRPLETVMSNSFGFGGTNGCLVLSRLDA